MNSWTKFITSYGIETIIMEAQSDWDIERQSRRKGCSTRSMIWSSLGNDQINKTQTNGEVKSYFRSEW